MKLLAVALVLVAGAACVTPDPRSGERAPTPSPIYISSLGDAFFAVQGAFTGTYLLRSSFIEVDIKTAEIQVVDNSRYKGRRRIGTISFALGRIAEDRKSWASLNKVQVFVVDRIMRPDESHRLDPTSFRIPIDPSLDLTKHWIMVEFETRSIDLPGAGLGTTYAHSKTPIVPGATAATTGPAAVQPGRAAVRSTLIDDLVTANRILAKHGVLDAHGHVSVRHDRDPNRYLLSRSRAPELVGADDIMEYDLDSNPLDAGGRPMYLERFLHGAIYRARPDVKAVVHNHTPALIPFGVTGVPLRPTHQSAAFIASGVPVFEIRAAGGMTDLLVRDAALGRAVAESLGDRNALLMRGHGAVVVAHSLPLVVRRSIDLELSAKLQTQAMALGGSITYLDPREARRIMEREETGLDEAWELWKRKALEK